MNETKKINNNHPTISDDICVAFQNQIKYLFHLLEAKIVKVPVVCESSLLFFFLENRRNEWTFACTAQLFFHVIYVRLFSSSLLLVRIFLISLRTAIEFNLSFDLFLRWTFFRVCVIHPSDCCFCFFFVAKALPLDYFVVIVSIPLVRLCMRLCKNMWLSNNDDRIIFVFA